MRYPSVTDGLVAMHIAASSQQIENLTDYLKLLQKWNRSYNLTAISEPAKMVSYHLLDSLSLMPLLLRANKVLDVGSGAGLPGIPLAIAMPETIWVMLDSNARKTRFIRQAIAHCGLHNAQVVQSRVQDYHAPDSLDFIVSRAYAPLAEFCGSVAHLLGPDTRLVTMKAGLKAKERQQLDSDRFNIEEEIIEVPGIGESRSLVTITPV